MSKDHKLEKALHASTDELYAVIGFKEHKDLHGLTPDFKKLVQIGQKWMTENLNRLQKVLCTNDLLRFAIKDKAIIELAVIMKNILLKDASKSPDVDAMVAIILKEGIVEYCGVYWK